MWLSNSLRLAFIAIAITLVLAACGGDTSTSSANYAQLQPVPTVTGLTVTSAAAEASSAGVQATADYEYVETLVQDFLHVRSEVIVRKADPSELEAVATGSAITAVVADRTANDAKADANYLTTVERLATWPNITAISARGTSLIVRDCTEQQQINAAGQFDMWFVDREYELVPVADTATEFTVASVTELHNGFLEADDRFGCVPQSFAERAETAATTAWSELIAAAQNPGAGTELSSVFNDSLREPLRESIANQDDEGLTLTSAEDVAFASIGIDTHVDLVQFEETHASTVVVESCRTFPDGAAFTDSTGTKTYVANPGDEHVQWIYVRIPNSPTTTAPDQVVLIEDHPELNCGGRP